MRNMLNSLLSEPRAPNPPARVWRDWALVAALAPTAVLEAVFREDIGWRPLSTVACLALLPTLLWRRTHPLATSVIAFGTFAVINTAESLSDVGVVGLNTSAFVLILVYALFRWGSGREAAIGLAVMILALVTGLTTGPFDLSELIGGPLVLLFPAELGAIVRYQGSLRSRQVEEIKLHEREQLARELHDTVAHHISAIAIQAQAGRTLAPSRPEAATEALAVIEEEASRTLSEMRGMVGALRRGDEPELVPQRGVADIERLAGSATGGPEVHVELSGELDNLGPTLDAALYRLAQESITNAARHARQATRVRVCVRGDDRSIQLTVSDDGVGGASTKAPQGYGLIGMAERAKLLGGTLDAGPNPDRGWTTNAVLPRSGSGG